jgi:serine protease Do
MIADPFCFLADGLRASALALAVVGSVVWADPRPASAAGGEFNVAEARKAVVFIRRITPGRETALGSGFLVSSDGVIYTSRHVVEPADPTSRGTLVLVGVPSAADPDDLDWFAAAVVYLPAVEEKLDFAILKIVAEQRYGKFAFLSLSYDKLELGAGVAVIGYPYIRENAAVLSFNKGSISSTRVRFGGKTYYQTDAAVNHGNSGGPLLNLRGEAVGIVTLKEMDAENVGFALYLGEIRLAAEVAARRLAEARPLPGPVDPGRLELPVTIAPQTASWQVGAGRTREEKRQLIIDNHGDAYWITSRQPLADDFQLVVPCGLEFMQGSQSISGAQRKSLRNLYVRFAAEDPRQSIRSGGGYRVESSHAALALYRDGRLVKSVARGNTPDKMFTLSITKQSGDIEIAIDGKVVLSWHDPRPLSARHEFSIGGYLSRLHLGQVAAIDLAKEGASAAVRPRATEAIQTTGAAR